MPTENHRQFSYLLIGQIIALFGSSLSGFALGVWAYQEVGSTTIYTAIALANILPIFILSPIAGAIVDRSNRKMIVLLANVATFCIVCLLFFLFTENLLAPWHIIALVTLNGVFAAFVLPAVAASIPLMVPKNQLTRANGFIALALGLVEFATPALAGSLFTYLGLSVIFISNLIAISIAISILIFCTIPQPKFSSAQEKKQLKQQSIWRSLVETWQYLLQTPAVIRLMVFYSVIVAMTMSMAILVQPMLLSLTDAKTMGITLSFASAGILVGSIAMIALKQVKRHMPLMLIVSVIVGVGCIFIPLSTTPWIIAICGFIVMCGYPIFDSNSRTLFQLKIEPTRLGRVIGIRNFILGFLQSMMFILVGPLADHFFEPAMQSGGWLTPVFGGFFGIGQGRGLAVMISLLGALILVATLIALLSKLLRSIDALPDVSVDIEANPMNDIQQPEVAPSIAGH